MQVVIDSPLRSHNFSMLLRYTIVHYKLYTTPIFPISILRVHPALLILSL